MSNKELKINQLKLGAILSYVNLAVGTIIPMFYTPVMLRLMGQSEYGLFNLSKSVVGYLSLISFGIGSAIVRYLTMYKAKDDKEGFENMFGMFNLIFRIISGIALISGFILAFCSKFIYADSLGDQFGKFRLLIIILSINVALTFAFTVYTTVVMVYEKFVFYQLMNILLTSVAPIVNIIILFVGFKSIGLTIVSLLISVLTTMCYIFFTTRRLKVKPKYNKLPKYLLPEIIKFSFWVFLANIVSQLYSTTDKLIIGAVPELATIGVAIYNIGDTFSHMILQFTLGVSSVLTPKINTMVFQGATKKNLTDVVIKFGRIQMYIVMILVTGFIAFGRPFIQLWAGDGYQEAFWVALVVMIPACVPLVQGVALQIIVAQNKHRFRSLVYLGIAVSNVIGTWLLVNSFGIIGAAIMTGFANIIGQGLIMNWYYWKKIGLQIPRFWKSILNICIIPIIMCVVTLFISTLIDFYNPMFLISGIAIYTVIFVLGEWIFAMNDYEKDIFRSPVKKLIRKFSTKVKE